MKVKMIVTTIVVSTSMTLVTKRTLEKSRFKKKIGSREAKEKQER